MPQPYIRKFRSLSPERSPADYVLLEDFEDGISAWTTSGNNASRIFTRDTAQAWRGLASVRVETGATTPAAGNWIGILRGTGNLEETRVMISLRVRYTSSSNQTLLRVHPIIGIRGSTRMWEPYFEIRRTATTTTIAVMNPDLSLTTIFTSTWMIPTLRWLEAKLIVNLVTGRYESLIFAGRQHNLIAFPMLDTTRGDFVTDELQIYLDTLEAANKIIHLDDIMMGTIS